MKFLKLLFIIHCSLFIIAMDAATPLRPTSNKGKSVIQQGTTVRAKVAATGLYSPECYDAYYGCMDQFCVPENSSGGSCTCSAENAGFEKQYAEIEKKLDEADRIKTIEVERIQAGANEDIIFGGTREYDANGNIISSTQKQTATESTKKPSFTSMLSQYEDTDAFEDAADNIGAKTGVELYNAAYDICKTQMPTKCTKDLTLLTQIYSTQIKSDCKAFENDLAIKSADATAALAFAQSEVRGALRTSFDAANKFDRGTCMIEFKKCMMTDDACGSDWSKCVSSIAAEKMQDKTKSTANTKIKHESSFEITDSTMERLDAKRMVCEKVLNQCVVVRDMVWPDFLREAAPTIKVAELNAESKMRQSCLTEISNCIHTACADDISQKGTATMDACLSRPDMARSFCKVQLDPCERMEPLIWGYVVDKLAAMRVDACTNEVKECFTSPDRCGPDFGNCIGMDYEYIHDMCPLDKLVVCKKNNTKFAMSDLDSMLMGFYLNVDNSALDLCQKKVDAKMNEICGSTTDCNKFAADDTIGTGSLRAQKDGTVYRVTGMISFGSIKMGNALEKLKDGKNKLGPGEIGVADYLDSVREKNATVPNFDGIVPSIEQELNNIAGTINHTIQLIESDPEIQYCVSGRDLSQITGDKGAHTKGRFPHLLDQVKMQIAMSALRAANNNYNTKFNAAIADATKDASADLAQYMCQKIAEGGTSGPTGNTNANTPLTPPYAISYDVGSGLTADELTRGGRGVTAVGGIKVSSTGGAGENKGSGSVTETSATFNRADRTCHVCKTTTTQSCDSKRTKGFFGIGAKNIENCKTDALPEKCEDIQM